MKERHFQANIKQFETLLTIWLYACEIEAYSKTPQNSKFVLDTTANIFPEKNKINLCINIPKEREE